MRSFTQFASTALVVLASVVAVAGAVVSWIMAPRVKKAPWHMNAFELFWAAHVVLPFKRLRWRAFGPALFVAVVAMPAGAQRQASRVGNDSLQRVVDSLGATLDLLEARKALALADRTCLNAVPAGTENSGRLQRCLETERAAAVAQAGSARRRVPALRRSHLRNDVFLGTVAMSVAAVAAFRVDPDPGGYPDVWRTNDKAIHAFAGIALVSLAEHAGVDSDAAWIGICAGAIGYEFAQARGGGYASGKDIVAGCAGAALPALVRKLFR